MQTDVLIVGQGLCGTHLSWCLMNEGKKFIVIDDGSGNSSSKVAAGIINPVTGRRYATTWMVEEVLDFSKTTYTAFGKYLDAELLFHKSVIDFFPTPQMRNSFVDRVSENDTYLHAYPDQNSFNPYFNYDFGCGEIRPAHIVNVQTILTLWRERLAEMKALQEERFVAEQLKVEKDGVRYGDITADKIVFCDGTASTNNPWFSLLPFSPNKGEALIIECNDLPIDHIFKRGILLAPLAQGNTFWVGANYQWDFEDDNPSTNFYNATTELLNNWLKLPYKVIDHKAAVRPATVERRPFAGFHPLYPAVGILNGMGSKGTSLAPFFANQMVQHIVHGLPIAPEADVHRFQRILSK